MKVKKLIEILENYKEFDVEFNFIDGYSSFPNTRSFSINGISDIGYSDKVIILDGQEK